MDNETVLYLVGGCQHI